MIGNKRVAMNWMQELQGMLDLYRSDAFDERILNGWSVLQEEAEKDDLQTMPIDTITTLAKRLPINNLMEVGIRTLYDVKGLSTFDLERINGVDSVFARDIIDTSDQIITSVIQHASPRIDPDDLSKEDIAIYVEKTQEQKELFESVFRSKKEKQAIHDEFNYINSNEVQHTYEHLTEDYKHIVYFDVSEEELRQHFNKENVAYYTEIEKITGIHANAEADNTPADIYYVFTRIFT